MTSTPAKSHELKQPPQPTLDEKKAEAFAQKMLNVLNSAGVALMVSIGHRTRLFEVMSKMLPSSSTDIARSAVLNERYVREWLGAMVTGGIVEFDPLTQAYRLPPEHSAFLTPAASPNNLAVTSQFISVLGQEKACAMLRDAGFRDVQLRTLPHDILNSYYIVRKVE